MKKVWEKIKASISKRFDFLRQWATAKARKEISEEIDGLMRHKDDLSNVIRRNLNPDKAAEEVIQYLQVYLHKLLNKVLGAPKQ